MAEPLESEVLEVEETPTEEIEVEAETEETPAETQAPEVDYAKEIESIKKALVSEQEARREEKRRAEFYQQVAQQEVARQKQPVKPAYDPEDLADFRGVEKVVDDRIGTVEAQLRQQIIDAKVNAARQEFPDWDEAFEIAKTIADRTPGLDAAIMASANPALTAYYIGKADPAYVNKAQKEAVSQATKKTVSKIQSNMKAPATLSDAGGASVKNTVEYFENLSDEELDKMVNKIKYS